MAAGRGWTGGQWDSLYQLVKHESGFRNQAQNPTSTAYGMFQFLDSTWGNYGRKTSDPAAQTKAGLAYIKSRYGNPQNAWSFWQKNNWYDKGAFDVGDDQNARVHKGEMIIPPRQAETIRAALLKDSGSPTSTMPGMGSSRGMKVEFGPGSIVIKVDGTMDDKAARQAAKRVVKYITEDDRLAKMGEGR